MIIKKLELHLQLLNLALKFFSVIKAIIIIVTP